MLMQGSLKFRKDLFQLRTVARESPGAQYADTIFQTPELKHIQSILGMDGQAVRYRKLGRAAKSIP